MIAVLWAQEGGRPPPDGNENRTRMGRDPEPSCSSAHEALHLAEQHKLKVTFDGRYVLVDGFICEPPKIKDRKSNALKACDQWRLTHLVVQELRLHGDEVAAILYKRQEKS